MVFCNRGQTNKKVWSTKSHNPYFNRWFSAIYKHALDAFDELKSQSLF